MNNDNKLNVWHDDMLVGKIWEDELGRIGFQYDVSWVKNGFAISQQLTLTDKPFEPNTKKAHLFFANLLPEAGARSHIIKSLKISDTDFNLLKAIGGECAGALSILPMNEKPNSKPQYKKLSDIDLKKMLLPPQNPI